MSKVVKKFKKFAAPAAAIAAPILFPGIGALASAAIGAGAGAVSGGGLKGALLGGVTGGLSGGLGSSIAGGLGLTGNAAKLASGALTGAAGGLASGGGLKSALMGAGLGGLGSVAMGSPGETIDWNQGGSSVLNPGSGLRGVGSGSETINWNQGGKTSIGKSGGLSSILKGGLGGSGSGGISLGNIGTALSGINSYNTQDELEEQLLAAQGKASRVLAPYQETGAQTNQMLFDELSNGDLGGEFNPGDLTQDPGYKFRLAEGEKARGRAMSAMGMMESGQAIKEAEEYGQGLADQTYNDAFNRWREQQSQRYNMLAGQSGQGLQAAGGMADVYGNIGNIESNADVGRSNIMTGTLSSILRGGGTSIVGYDANGDPIYDWSRILS
jgi:hypothetical protein